MDEIVFNLNASKLPPGVTPPQSLSVRVDEQLVAHIIRVNGPGMQELCDGPLEGVARTLMRVASGGVPEFEQENFRIVAMEDTVTFATPGYGMPLLLSRAGLEELAARLIIILRDESESLLESEQQLKPLHEIPVGKLINNQVKMEVEDIELL